MEYYMATTDIKSSPWRKGFSMENGKKAEEWNNFKYYCSVAAAGAAPKAFLQTVKQFEYNIYKNSTIHQQLGPCKNYYGQLALYYSYKRKQFLHLPPLWHFPPWTSHFSLIFLSSRGRRWKSGKSTNVFGNMLRSRMNRELKSEKKKQLGEFDCMHVSVLLLSFDVLMTEPNIMQRKLPRNPSPSNFGLHFLAHWLLYTWNGDTAIPSICKHCTNINRTNTQVTCTGSVTFKGTSSAVSISVSFEDKLPPRHYWRPKYQNVWPQKLSIEMNR